MRILMALWEGGGTVPVEVGLAARLTAAGHDVTVLAEPNMAQAVASAGARFLSWQSVPHPVQDHIADWECATPLGLFRRLLDRLVTGPSALFAADLRAVASREHVDAVVVDVALIGAMVGAESLGLPVAVSMPGTYVRPTPGEPPFGLGLRPANNPVTRLRDSALPRALNRMWNLGLGDLNATRRDLGLDPLDNVMDQLDRAERVLVFTAESFDFPTAKRPANVRYVGPVLDDPVWAADLDTELPAGDEPLVLVGLSGTRIRGGQDLLRRVVAGLADAPLRAIVPTGPWLERVPSPRAGIRVVPAASHTRLLPHADAVITHGGHGTVIKALAAGLPTLVLPLGRDQPDVAARVVWHGAGLRLRSGAGPGRITRAITDLVSDPGFASAARALSVRIHADTNDRRAVAEIESMIGKG